MTSEIRPRGVSLPKPPLTESSCHAMRLKSSPVERWSGGAGSVSRLSPPFSHPSPRAKHMSQEATLEVGPEPQLRQPQLLELPPAVGVTTSRSSRLRPTHRGVDEASPCVSYRFLTHGSGSLVKRLLSAAELEGNGTQLWATKLTYLQGPWLLNPQEEAPS